jgi:hypothetical protein
MSDEAHFHFSGLVNKLNLLYWLATNPKGIYERPLNNSKATEFYAISLFGIVGPYFFKDEWESSVTVTGRRYLHTLESF